MNTRKFHLPGEAALLIVLLINPLAIDLCQKAYLEFQQFPPCRSSSAQRFQFSVSESWIYIFQTLLVINPDGPEAFVLSRLSVFFCCRHRFGKMIDVHNTWVTLLPNVLSLNVVCFFTGFLLMCFGICLANNCLLPIVPTDIFPRICRNFCIKSITRSRQPLISPV